ncbi:MAG: Rieske (2Fe-2S) protein [Sporichthyaceae bacterium]
MSIEHVQTEPCVHRRTLLTGLLAAGVAGGLAACGGGDDGGSAPAALPPDAPSGTLASTADIEVGGGRIIKGANLVITQPTAGEFKAFTATCTHESTDLNKVSDGLITCPRHGSAFSVTDGSVVRSPAPSPLTAVAITVKNGFISLA